VDGVERSYAVATASPRGGPILAVFHGQGISSNVMAGWTGLAVRGPAAGFATVFPDAVGEVWDDTGLGRTDGVDDAGFVTAVIEDLAANGIGAGGRPILAGLSNGATFIEHLARRGLVDARGIVLVAGTSRRAAGRTEPQPAQPCAVLCIAGTEDPYVPYEGGRATGLRGWMARRRTRTRLIGSGTRESIGPETLAREWAGVNGCGDVTIRSPAVAGDLPVERLTWSCPDRPPVELYRVNGGGHGWPGGPQYVPRFVIGRIAKSFDATALALDFARSLTT
jgi:polyhydroxybutyrate depolymerase